MMIFIFKNVEQISSNDHFHLKKCRTNFCEKMLVCSIFSISNNVVKSCMPKNFSNKRMLSIKEFWSYTRLVTKIGFEIHVIDIKGNSKGIQEGKFESNYRKISVGVPCRKKNKPKVTKITMTLPL